MGFALYDVRCQGATLSLTLSQFVKWIFPLSDMRDPGSKLPLSLSIVHFESPSVLSQGRSREGFDRSERVSSSINLLDTLVDIVMLDCKGRKLR